MARYFLDTNCLIGYTFVHDRWFPDSKRLFGTDNTLYTGRNAVYEYCSSREENNRHNAEVYLEDDDGLYGEKRAKTRLKLTQFGKYLQTYSDEELDVDTVTEEYISRFDMRESEEEVVRPRIRGFFEWYFEKEGNVSQRTSRQAARKLKDLLMERSIRHKQKIEERVNLEPIREEEYPELTSKMKRNPPGITNSADIALLCDAVFLDDREGITRIVTGDFNDIYSSQTWIQEHLGFSVLSLLDTFAGEDSAEASLDLEG